MIDSPFVYPELTVRENLWAAARLHGVPAPAQATAAARTADRLELGPVGRPPRQRPPWATGSGSAWAALSPTARGCWCWTNRPTPSTRSGCCCCASCCSALPAPARPCWSPATTWTRWPGSPTGSASSTPAPSSASWTRTASTSSGTSSRWCTPPTRPPARRERDRMSPAYAVEALKLRRSRVVLSRPGPGSGAACVARGFLIAAERGGDDRRARRRRPCSARHRLDRLPRRADPDLRHRRRRRRPDRGRLVLRTGVRRPHGRLALRLGDPPHPVAPPSWCSSGWSVALGSAWWWPPGCSGRHRPGPSRRRRRPHPGRLAALAVLSGLLALPVALPPASGAAISRRWAG